MLSSEIFSYALKHYHNPVCRTAEEFSSDYNTAIRIRKLIARKNSGGDFSYRLLLNHFMRFYNVFAPNAATVLLFIRLPKDQYSTIKTVATFLNFMPDSLAEYGIDVNTIEFDQDMITFLRSI